VKLYYDTLRFCARHDLKDVKVAYTNGEVTVNGHVVENIYEVQEALGV
jgi:osmotically-inducible protein OsmY